MDLGHTQRTLAQRLHCCLQTVSKWERGISLPLASHWGGIATVLGPELVPTRDGFPGRLRTARLRLGLTQAELARRMGVHERTVRNLETGTSGPSQATLERLRAILGDSR
jgi:transcriptional regulator with XRE-family HTH domain